MIFVNCFDKNMYALSITGKLLWTFATGAPVYSSALVVDNTPYIYFGSNDGNMYCVDMKTGQKKWSFHAPEYLLDNRFIHVPTLSVDGKTLLAPNMNHQLYGLDPESGKPHFFFIGFCFHCIVRKAVVQHYSIRALCCFCESLR